MRLAWLVLIIGATASARADKQIQDLIPGFAREVEGCEVQVSGVTKIATGAAALVKTAGDAERDELARDVDALTRGRQQASSPPTS